MPKRGEKMTNKRVTLLCGHYGSGKTNIAVNLALSLAKTHPRVAIADLDIVNPYFRTKDSAAALAAAGVRLICSAYANSNLDIPALPQDLYAVTDDKGLACVVDVGGDDRGALALGRIVPALLAENDYEMLMVINAARPLTRTAGEIAEVLAEITAACGMAPTGLVNNTNLGAETTADVVRKSQKFAAEAAAVTGLPLVATTVEARLFDELKSEIPHLFPLTLQPKLL